MTRLQASASSPQVQPSPHLHARGDCRLGRELYVHLPHGLPRRLPADWADPTYLELLWPSQAILTCSALATEILRPGLMLLT